MSGEYVPTTDEVREDFAYPWEGFKQNREGRLAAFDRWHAAELAAAERRGAVRALREVAEWFDRRHPETGEGNGRAYNSYTVAAIIHERADREDAA